MIAQPINTSRVAPTIPQTDAVTTKPTTKGFNDMSSEDFFGLLIAQLQSQDPMKPTDNQTLMTQMSTIKQMQMSSQLNSTLSSLSSEQRFGSTSALIGHYVVGSLTDSGGNPVEVQGVVTGVHFEKSGNAILELHNGVNLPADKVTEVTVVQNLPQDQQQQLSAASATGSKTKAQSLSIGSKKSAVTVDAGHNSVVSDVLNTLLGAGGSVGVSI